MRRAPTKVQCVECSLIWCFQCHSPWHDGIQCKEFRRGDRMLKKWAREVHYGQHNAQQCPSCKVKKKIRKYFIFIILFKVYIQRTKGCDHIVCLRCKTEFCYKCGGRFRDIKFIGDHYSELSVLGCKYRFYPDRPFKRRLIRGSILCGKILAAPIVLCLAVVAGAVCAGIGLPAYCCFMLVRHIKVQKKTSCFFCLF
jgi:E3 ubiquitin-protein ligase RNF217